MTDGDFELPKLALLHIWNVAAAGLWYYVLHRRLRYLADKQETGTLVVFVLAGIFSVFLTLLFHTLYPLQFFLPFVYEVNLFYQILVTGVLEESAKFICFLAVVHSIEPVKEPQDGVIQAAVVGLAFGTIENIVYIERYGTFWMAVRPIITTGAHTIYGAIWGGYYSSALYSNVHSRDPAAYRQAFLGLGLVAVIHGLYNAMLVLGLWLSLLINLAALALSIRIFLQLVDTSPYRTFPLSQSELAYRSIRRGLVFNPKSAILNRNAGLYLMRLGRYTEAAAHFARSVPRSYDPRRARFFAAVCEWTCVPKPHAQRLLRNTWSRLSDAQRLKVMVQLEQLLQNDPALLGQVREFLGSAFTSRDHKPAHELARELKIRKAERRYGSVSPVYDELVRTLTPEERYRLREKLRTRS